MPKDVSKKILDATLEVIAKEKISGTRMRLIAEEADMTQSNLHYYFPTKDDLLIALLHEIQNRFSENRKKVVDLDKNKFEKNLAAIFDEKKDVILNNKKLDYVQFDYWVQGTANPEVREKFRETFNIWRHDIQEVFNQAVINGEIDASEMPMLPFIMVSLMMGASMQYLIDEGKFDLDEYFTVSRKVIVNLIDDAKTRVSAPKTGDEDDDPA